MMNNVISVRRKTAILMRPICCLYTPVSVFDMYVQPFLCCIPYLYVFVCVQTDTLCLIVYLDKVDYQLSLRNTLGITVNFL